MILAGCSKPLKVQTFGSNAIRCELIAEKGAGNRVFEITGAAQKQLAVRCGVKNIRPNANNVLVDFRMIIETTKGDEAVFQTGWLLG